MPGKAVVSIFIFRRLFTFFVGPVFNYFVHLDMIKIPLRIILVEDEKTDIGLIKRHIGKIVEDPIIEVVEDLPSFQLKLLHFIPDVVISDYNLPTCTGLEILEITRAVDESTPFIFLTGTIDDESLAANTILANVTGFVLKKDMKVLDEKLKPLLKKVVFNMVPNEGLRERIRENKKTVNQIYSYLDNLNANNSQHLEKLNKLKQKIKNKDLEKDDADKP